MSGIKEIKNRIGSVAFTKQITKAMKMVSASKLRRSQNLASPVHFYHEKLKGILGNIYSDIYHSVFDMYVKDRGSDNVLLVVLTSDRGLCGSFNSVVLRRAMKYINESSFKSIKILPIGKKGFKFFKKRKFDIIDEYSNLLNKLNFINSKNVSEHIVSEFKNSNYDKIEIVYNKYINNMSQKITLKQFLPVNDYSLVENKVDYIYEPSSSHIGLNLISDYLDIDFYSMTLSSVVSEHASRMISMGKATDNATELLKDLKLVYNRTRQASITKEMLEIVNGAEAC
ncbi:MAG: ATP synthase F1 subunit gamma [Cytophagales bacterium]